MKLTNIHVDDQGHSYFGEVELPQTGNAGRISAKPQDVEYWQMSQTLPGHYVDFTVVPESRVISGGIFSQVDHFYFIKQILMCAFRFPPPPPIK